MTPFLKTLLKGHGYDFFPSFIFPYWYKNYVQNKLTDRKINLKKNFNRGIEQMYTNTFHWPCLDNKELWAQYLAHNFTNDIQILVDH